MSAPISEEGTPSLCADFMRFQELLKNQRKGDDSILNLINSSIPSIQSLRKTVDIKAKCAEIKSKLEESHKTREEEIKKCIAYHAVDVERLRKAKEDADESNILQSNKEFGNAQRKLRVLQAELGVEEIVQDRTRKALHERCREYF